MNIIKSLKIKQKLMLSFMVIVLLTALLGGYAIYQLYSINDENYSTYKTHVWTLETLEKTKSAFATVRRTITIAVARQGDNDTTMVGKALATFHDSVESMNNAVDAHIARLKQVGASQDDIDIYEKVKATFNNDYIALTDRVEKDLINNDMKKALDEITQGQAISSGLENQLSDIFAESMRKAGVVADNNRATAATTQIILIIIYVLVVLVSVIMAIMMGNSTSRPIKRLGSIAKEIANGNFSNAESLASNSKDEIGELTRDLSVLSATVNNLVADLTAMSLAHNEGETDVLLNHEKYNGLFAQMAKNVNIMATGHILMTQKSIEVITQMVEGKFDVPMEKLTGKRAFINDSIESMRKSIKDVGNEINIMIKEALLGNLLVKADVSKFKGDWIKTMSGLNDVLTGITVPVLESSKVLKEISKGNLSMKVTGNYNGDLAELANTVNSTIETIGSYIKEISEVLQQIAERDLSVTISRQYVGDFKEVKSAITTITEKFNSVLSEIDSASTQVTLGAQQISESSMGLAEGSTVQANTVHQLANEVDEINSQSQNNVINTRDANSLSYNSSQNAVKGNEQMQKLLVSMEGIKEASKNINVIIKVIEDIAFQTNLLALNAAVEAARAGEHGKGFSVVAEEVRNLASRSQQAAKETTDLIERSIEKVNEGTLIANETALSLNAIVEDANHVSLLISEIAASSSQQADSVQYILEGLNQISHVVQSNSATSQETAAASEELHSQAESLKNMLHTFKLTK